MPSGLPRAIQPTAAAPRTRSRNRVTASAHALGQPCSSTTQVRPKLRVSRTCLTYEEDQSAGPLHQLSRKVLFPSSSPKNFHFSKEMQQNGQPSHLRLAES